MPHENRGRIVIALNKKGDWQQHVPSSLLGSLSPIGMVTRGGKTGALARCKSTNKWVMVAEGVVTNLPQKKVEAVLAEVPNAVGAPRKMQGGRAVRVYLDEGTVEQAKKLGGGNVSEGLRIAVRLASK